MIGNGSNGGEIIDRVDGEHEQGGGVGLSITGSHGDGADAKLIGQRSDDQRAIGAVATEQNVCIRHEARIGGSGGDNKSAERAIDIIHREGNGGRNGVFGDGLAGNG